MTTPINPRARKYESEKYVNNVLAILSNMIRMAKALRRIKELPLESFGLFKIDTSKPPPFYTEEEFRGLVDSPTKIDVRLAAIFLLGGDADSAPARSARSLRTA